jgi:hypothetical protein
MRAQPLILLSDQQVPHDFIVLSGTLKGDPGIPGAIHAPNPNAT